MKQCLNKFLSMKNEYIPSHREFPNTLALEELAGNTEHSSSADSAAVSNRAPARQIDNLSELGYVPSREKNPLKETRSAEVECTKMYLSNRAPDRRIVDLFADGYTSLFVDAHNRHISFDSVNIDFDMIDKGVYPIKQLYNSIECPHGEFGVYFAGNGKSRLQRCKINHHSFHLMQALEKIILGQNEEDLFLIASSLGLSLDETRNNLE
jgi:hypothetical protein